MNHTLRSNNGLRTIGILAGMGPRSTTPFIDMVLDECQQQYGAHDDIDYPHMLIYSLPTPFYLDRPLDHAALEKAIVAGARRLASTGVDFIAMPCNTAHIFYDAIAASVSVPVLNMVKIALAQLPDKVESVSVLATRATVDAGVYQLPLMAGGITVDNRSTWQDQVDGLLRMVKVGSPECFSVWRALCHQLRDAGIGAAVLACTDLNAIIKANRQALPLIDATHALAAETVRQWLALN